MSHPTDAPEHAGLRALFRTTTLGMAALLAVITVGFGLVVTFALDNVPLAGNWATLGGFPALTAAAGLLTPLVVAAAVVHGRVRMAQAVRRARSDHPEVAGPDTDGDRIMTAVGARLFGTLIVLLAAGFVCAVLYHLTSSAGLLGCVAVFAGAMLVFYPSGRRVRGWYDAAAAALARDRRG